jgi:hypothetical protein
MLSVVLVRHRADVINSSEEDNSHAQPEDATVMLGSVHGGLP